MRVNLFFGNKIKFERYDRENEFNNLFKLFQKCRILFLKDKIR